MNKVNKVISDNIWIKDFEYNQYFNRFIPYSVYHAIYSLLGYSEPYNSRIKVMYIVF